MNPSIKTTYLFTMFILFASIPSTFADEQTTAFQWQSSSPQEQGLSKEKLQVLLKGLQEHATDELIIIRYDRVVLEWYAPKFGPEVKHYTASLAKALVGGMSLLVALQDGLLAIDDPAQNYIDAWKDDPTRAGITIRQLATHSSGVEDANVDGMDHLALGGWKSRFWRQDPDPFTISRDWAPMKFKPGTGFEYSNPGMALLSYAITAALKNSPQHDVRTLLRDRIMRPIGIEDSKWSCGYGKIFTVDGLPLVANWGGGNYTARAVARIGRLMLHRGNWQGTQILESPWIEKVTTDAGCPEPFRGAGEGPCPRAGLAWWVNSDGILSALPHDAFMGAGAGNQVLLVIPSLDLIVVRFGNLMKPDSFWGGMEEYLFNPLMDCIIQQK